jgi:small subunit ribosomal protein S14
MAKKSSIERNNKRIELSQAKRKSRLALKEIVKKGSPEEAYEAMLKLAKAKRDESPCRIRGRPHGTYRKFALCRLCLREAVMMRGDVPGLRKASW